MAVRLRLGNSLKNAVGGQSEYEVQAGLSVREAVKSLGIDPLTVAMVVVNKVQESKDYVLQDGDDVLLMAVVGGG